LFAASLFAASLALVGVSKLRIAAIASRQAMPARIDGFLIILIALEKLLVLINLEPPYLFSVEKYDASSWR
jgi:hypothetical protein